MGHDLAARGEFPVPSLKTPGLGDALHFVHLQFSDAG